MAGILTNANYINDTIKPAIKSAIEAQGVTVPSTDSFLDYADRIAEIEGGGGDGYVLQDLPTGSISSFNDGVDLPLNSLKVSIEAVQSGSGTPSPSNIRPITGWDSVEVSDVGKNWFTFGTYTGSEWKGVTYTVDTSTNTLSKSGTSTSSQGTNVAAIKVKGGTYILSATFTETKAVTSIYLQRKSTGANIDFIRADAPTKIMALTDGEYYIRLATSQGETDGSISNIRLELGTTATTYEPYQGKTTTIPLSSTCYGGELDVTSGELKVTHGNIASYNGETLPSTWISSMDEYTAGGTPTTGAQVVYELATPTTIQVQPTAIRTLEGVNNLWADCGDVIEGEYFSGSAPKLSKVDYTIGSGSQPMLADGRYLSGFASMSGYGAFPRDAEGDWLDVDWSDDFEIGVRFKLTSLSNMQTFFGDGGNNSFYKAPIFGWYQPTQKLWIGISNNGSSLALDQELTYAMSADVWCFAKMTFVKSDLNLKVEISTDFETFTTLYNDTLASAPYHNSASFCFGGRARSASEASNTCVIDTYNTYIKDNSGSIVWGAYKGA